MNWGRIKKLIECSRCGGQSLYDAEQITGICPFCGSTSVAPAAENEQIMAPNAVIPFSISREKAQQIFVDYLKRSQLVSKKTYDCKLENLTGIYLPFWTYDAYSVTTYIASSSNNAPEGVRFYKGVWNQYINDAIIYASKKFRSPYMPKLQEFNYEEAVPYSPEYLAGIPAERYTFGKKTYPVIINGQTGKTIFQVPRYLTKLIILASIGAVLFLALYFAFMFLLPEPPFFWIYRLLNN